MTEVKLRKETVSYKVECSTFGEDCDAHGWHSNALRFATKKEAEQYGFDLSMREGLMPFSPAANFHARIYQLRPDVNAIVHLHSHFISVLSSTGRTVGMYNVGSVLFHEDQATYFDDGHKAHVDVAAGYEARTASGAMEARSPAGARRMRTCSPTGAQTDGSVGP